MPILKRALRKVHLWPKKRNDRGHDATEPAPLTSASNLLHGSIDSYAVATTDEAGNRADDNSQVGIVKTAAEGTDDRGNGVTDSDNINKALRHGQEHEDVAKVKRLNDHELIGKGPDNNGANHQGRETDDPAVSGAINDDINVSVDDAVAVDDEFNREAVASSPAESPAASEPNHLAATKATLSASQQRARALRDEQLQLIRHRAEDETQAIVFAGPVEYHRPVVYHSSVRYLEPAHTSASASNAPQLVSTSDDEQKGREAPNLNTIPPELQCRIFKFIQFHDRAKFHSAWSDTIEWRDHYDLEFPQAKYQAVGDRSGNWIYNTMDFYEYLFICKGLYETARKFLYRFIPALAFRPLRLGHLVRTLVENPHLRRLVRYMDMPVGYEGCPRSESPRGRRKDHLVSEWNLHTELPLHEVMRSAHALIDEGFGDLYHRFRERIDRGQWGAFAGIILFLVPQLKELNLLVNDMANFKFQYRDEFWGDEYEPEPEEEQDLGKFTMAGMVLLAKAHSHEDRNWTAMLTETLTALETVRFEYFNNGWDNNDYGRSYEIDMSTLLRVAGIPNLKTLQMRGIRELHEGPTGYDNSYPHWGVVKNIDFRSVEFHPCHLSWFLSECDGVESLCVRWAVSSVLTHTLGSLEDWSGPWGEDVAHWCAALGRQLRYQSSTIRKLTLDPETDSWPESWDQEHWEHHLLDSIWRTPICGSIGSLSSLEKLTVLEIDDRFLCPHARQDTWGDPGFSGVLAQQLQNFFPSPLESFTLHTRVELNELATILQAIVDNAHENLNHVCINMLVNPALRLYGGTEMLLAPCQQTTDILVNRDIRPGHSMAWGPEWLGLTPKLWVECPLKWPHHFSTYAAVGEEIVVRFEATKEETAEERDLSYEMTW